MNVLIDTTIWSVSLRKGPKNHAESVIKEKLMELIDEGRVRIFGPIRQEVLSGISSSNSR